MATVEENRAYWSVYDWANRGEEWSEAWGGSSAQWWGSLWPRIRLFLPCRSAVEIASGHGRWSAFLAGYCEALDLLDLTPEAVEACRRRFANLAHVRVCQTDGRTLPGVADRAVDFVFSFDSLVHVELDVIEAYLAEIARVLAPQGVAFLHHSNFAALLADRPLGLENRGGRAESVSGISVAEAAERAGIPCIGQELVNWGCPWLTDAFTLLARPESHWARPMRRRENPGFMEEALSVGRSSDLFGEAGFPRRLE